MKPHVTLPYNKAIGDQITGSLGFFMYGHYVTIFHRQMT